MKRTVIGTLLIIGLIPILVSAQRSPIALTPDHFGKPDTVFAEINMIDDYQASVTISYWNDEDIVGLAVPFKMSDDLNKLVADSAIFAGGRIDDWSYKGFRADTAIQAVTLGMIANIGASDYKLTSGSGRIVTVFISSLEDKKIKNLVIDTTTTYPGNYLMTIVDMFRGTDSTLIDIDDREFTPIWVIRKSK